MSNVELTVAQIRQFQDALLSAVVSESDLAQMVLFGLGERLPEFATTSGTLRDKIYDLLNWVQSRGKMADLIRAARNHNPGNNNLRAFEIEMLEEVTPSEASLPIGLDYPTSSTFDQTHILLAYAPDDATIMQQLTWALQARGMAVTHLVHKDRALPINEARINALVTRSSDSLVLYLSKAALKDKAICQCIAQAATLRLGSDSKFAVVPVFGEITTSALGRSTALADLRTLISLTSHHRKSLTSTSACGPLAKHILNLALPHRLHHDVQPSTSLRLGIRTYVNQPSTPPLHLYLDWFPLFSDSNNHVQVPPPERWNSDLLPALNDIAAAITGQLGVQEVEVWMKAVPSVAIALGYALPPKVRPVFWHQDRVGSVKDLVWTYYEQLVPLPGAEYLAITCELTDPPGSVAAAILAASITVDVNPAIHAWMKHAAQTPRWYITAKPITESSTTAIQSSVQAATWVHQIGVQIRQLWQEDKANAIHVFLAGPVAFAGLLGQELYSWALQQHPVYLYELDPDKTKGYQHVCTLGG